MYTHRLACADVFSSAYQEAPSGEDSGSLFVGHELLVRLWSNSSEVKRRKHYPYIQLILNSDGKAFTERKLKE